MRVGRIAAFVAALAAIFLGQSAIAANLLRNASFEQTPCATPCNQSVNVAPAEWLPRDGFPGATFSNDGSYGYSPDAYGNFTGATAQDGIRWVAAFSFYNEAFGQQLTTPLVPGATYTISAYVRQPARSDLINPATIQFELWDSTSGSNAIVLGSFLTPIAVTQAGWELRTLTFTAPADSAAYPFFYFRPVKLKRGEVYPGVDNLTLVQESGGSGDGGGGGGTCSGTGAGGTLVINGCDTQVPDATSAGTCISNALLACAAVANHGDYVSCVTRATNDLTGMGLITGQQKSRIQSCAAKFGTP